MPDMAQMPIPQHMQEPAVQEYKYKSEIQITIGLAAAEQDAILKLQDTLAAQEALEEVVLVVVVLMENMPQVELQQAELVVFFQDNPKPLGHKIIPAINLDLMLVCIQAEEGEEQVLLPTQVVMVPVV